MVPSGNTGFYCMSKLYVPTFIVMSSQLNVRHIWKYLQVQNLRNSAQWGSRIFGKEF